MRRSVHNLYELHSLERATQLLRGVLSWLQFNGSPREVLLAARQVTRFARLSRVDASWARAFEFEAALALGRRDLARKLMRAELAARHPRLLRASPAERESVVPEFVATWEQPVSGRAARLAVRRPAWSMLSPTARVSGPELREAFPWFPPARADERTARAMRDLGARTLRADVRRDEAHRPLVVTHRRRRD